MCLDKLTAVSYNKLRNVLLLTREEWENAKKRTEDISDDTVKTI